MNAYAIPGIPREGQGSIKPKFDIVLETVSTYFNIPSKLIIKKGRKGEHVICRQIISYLCCHYYKTDSLPGLGKKLNRDHTTIMHSRDFVIGQINARFDSPFKKWVKEIIHSVENNN